jgi:poly(A) polymerase
MATFGLGECREVGIIKERIKNAILDGEIPNDHNAARGLMIGFAAEELGLHPVDLT